MARGLLGEKVAFPRRLGGFEGTFLEGGPDFLEVASVSGNFHAELNSSKPSDQGASERSAAKGVRSFFSVLVTSRSLFLTLLSLFSSLFCQNPFAGLLLRQGDRKHPQTSKKSPHEW